MSAEFVSLVERNRRRLEGIARSYAPGSDWEDLYQECLVQLWKSLPDFAGRSSVDTWVYRVALNTAITWRRRATVRPPLVQDDASEALTAAPDPHAPGARSELAILEEFLQSLGKIDRALLLLYLDDRSYREMAEITGLSETNVGARLSRLKKKFIDRYVGA
jgi:RNA polymerase sigma-70 factor (ECF subfamily)